MLKIKWTSTSSYLEVNGSDITTYSKQPENSTKYMK